MLRALANGETNAAPIAALAVPGLRATPQELCDALSGAADMRPLRRQILKLFLERLQWIESQMDQLDQSLGAALRQPQDSVTRLAEVPGLGADAAQQIMAAVGPHAVTFPWAGQPASWVGCCPGREESAEVCRSDRSPKGSRHMRRILNQGANAAVKAKGSVFENLYRRLWPQLGHAQAIWAGAHKLCRVVWKVLHDGIRYQEQGYRPHAEALRQRPDDSFEIFAVLVIRFSSQDRTKALLYDGPLFNGTDRIFIRSTGRRPAPCTHKSGGLTATNVGPAGP